MEQILNSFGDIVTNASDSLRLHEECDLLSLRLDKVPLIVCSPDQHVTCRGGFVHWMLVCYLEVLVVVLLLDLGK